MNREEAEILVARYFEGDLSAAEKDALNKELANDRELALLFSDQDLAHRNLETLKLRWSLPADFAARVTEDLPVLEKEKLVARYFDGDLSTAEKDQLKRELAQDRDLAALFSDQEIAHRDLETLKLRWTLPADFSSSVLADLPAEREAAPVARIYSIHWKQVAMAASVAIVAGLIFTMSYVSQPVEMPPIADGGFDRNLPPAAPRAHVSTFSSGDVRVSDAGSTVVNKTFKGDVILPAEITAPADTHVVLNIGNGTAVLPKGGKARLIANDGRVAIEPIEGDLYLESDADGLVDASVSDVSVSVQRGGVTLRKQGEKYFAEPSHGKATLRGRKHTASVSAHEMQFGVISQDGAIEIQKGEGAPLADWAAAGRADELKRHVVILMKLKESDISVERWNEVIKAMAAQPSERARQAAFMQFMVDEKLLEQVSPEQQGAFAAIAKILAEGTSEDDIDKDTRDAVQMMKEMLKDEQARQWVKFMIKGWFDDCGRVSRGEAGHRPRRDVRGRGAKPPREEPKEEPK